VTERIYGLVLAMSVIASSRYYGLPDAGRAAFSVLSVGPARALSGI
jgi:hypothetical protein